MRFIINIILYYIIKSCGIRPFEIYIMKITPMKLQLFISVYLFDPLFLMFCNKSLGRSTQICPCTASTFLQLKHELTQFYRQHFVINDFI